MSARGQAAALRLAERQHGIITREQLAGLGCADRTTRRRVEEGIWISIGHGVYRMRGATDDLAARSRAVAAQIPDAVLAGPSAAAIRGRRDPWESVGLGQTPYVIGRWRSGVAARFVTHPGVSTSTIGGITVASVTDTVIDLLRFLPAGSARLVAYRACQTRILTVADLTVACERLVRCSGAPQLRAITADMADGAQSEAERLAVKILQEMGVTGWVTQHEITLPDGSRAVIDIAFPERLIAIEVDGRAFHTDAARFERDRRRQNMLVQYGWTVLRFTWTDVAERPRSVAERIRATLARGSSFQPGRSS